MVMMVVVMDDGVDVGMVMMMGISMVTVYSCLHVLHVGSVLERRKGDKAE